MYEISVDSHFDAAHYLRGYQGKCESLHGHRFQVTVGINCQQLNDIGLGYDFTELKQHLHQVLTRFDHTCLNDIPPFDEINPSSENIAFTIYTELNLRISGELASLSHVEVGESPESRVTYRP